MVTCPRCNRHVRAAETRCPFCLDQGLLGRVGTAVGAAGLGAFLAACYGVGGIPAPDTDSGFGEDADADGFRVEDGDCDDFDPFVNPDAEEVCDDEVDNDCDGLLDLDDDDCVS